jgi:hypothetical protein
VSLKFDRTTKRQGRNSEKRDFIRDPKVNRMFIVKRTLLVERRRIQPLLSQSVSSYKSGPIFSNMVRDFENRCSSFKLYLL